MKTISALFLLTVIAIGCKKYEEGPIFSLRSKKERLANTWKVAQWLENGVDKTNDFNNIFNGYVMTINKENTYSLTYKAFGIIPYSESGSWYFNTNKTSVTFKNNNNNTSTWKILKLMEKELWGEFKDSNKVIKVHLIPL